MYTEAIALYRSLSANEGCEKFEPFLTAACNNAGLFYVFAKKFGEAERLLLESLEIRRRFANQVSLEAYKPDIAESLNNLGLFYSETNMSIPPKIEHFDR